MDHNSLPPAYEATMPSRKPAIVSAILTVLILALLALLSALLQMVALNGASERQGITALGISLTCQGAVIILAAIVARWLTQFLITKADWNPIMAVITVVLVTATVAGAITFLFMIIAIPVAGIR
jgi:hypothetical protein